MILSAREYAKKYAGNCSAKTVIRKAQRGLLPTNHKAKKVAGRHIIEIQDLSHLKEYNLTAKLKR